MKWKHELTKIQRKKNFINRLKHAEHKILCICVDVHKIYEGNDYNKLYEVLSTLKDKKLKLNNILIENYNDMLENPDFGQDHYSRTATSFYKIGHDSIRLKNWICSFYGSQYKNNYYYDLMGSIRKHLKEISQRWILYWSKRSSIKHLSYWKNYIKTSWRTKVSQNTILSTKLDSDKEESKSNRRW